MAISMDEAILEQVQRQLDDEFIPTASERHRIELLFDAEFKKLADKGITRADLLLICAECYMLGKVRGRRGR